MLAAYLLSLRGAASELGEADEPILIRTILDHLAMALSADAEARAPGEPLETVIGYSARREIERRLGSPSLTIANICRALGVSRSTLHRVFEKEGGVRNYIREARLEAARQVLMDPNDAEPIYALAEKFGFSDAAHFSRLFRARYGMTPSNCRTKARDTAPSHDGNIGTD
jgi:AraC-like DNA-binding protein